MSTPHRDPVSAREILTALATVRRRGRWPILQDLEQSDPELASHVMEELSLIHKTLLDTGVPAKLVHRLNRQTQTLVLVVVLAVRGPQDEPDAPDTLDERPASQA